MTRIARFTAAALLLAACSTRGEDATVRYSFHNLPGSKLSTEMLTVRWSSAAGTGQVTGPQMLVSEGGPVLIGSPKYHTATAGTLTVDVTFTDGAAVVSSGRVELPLKGDREWAVDLQADTLDPTRGCFGCTGHRAFPIAPAYRRSPADSLYVVWSGSPATDAPIIF